MACTGTEQINNIPAIPNPNDGIDAYVTSCIAYDNWFTTEAVPKLNTMFPCINGWYGTISGWYTEIGTWRTEIEGWKNDTWQYREDARGFADNAETSKNEAQAIVDGISTELPEGTISDETVGDQTAWSSEKIVREIHNQGIQSLAVDADSNITEIVYQDGAKTTYTYNTDGMPVVERYIDKDGTTIRYTYTYSWTEDGTLISMVRS